MISVDENEFENDEGKFANLIFGLGEYFGKTVTPAVIGIYWNVLKGYEFSDVDKAVANLLADPSHEFFGRIPLANEIIAALPSHKSIQWMTADETWPIVVQAYDRNATVVFPNEESQIAWLNFGEPVYSHRDQNPARMAYRAAYDRLVAESKASGKRPKAIPSLGQDPLSRQFAIDDAIQKGYLTHDSVPDALMIGHESSNVGRHIAGLLGGPVESLPKLTGDERSRLAKLREAMAVEKSPDQVLAEYLELQGRS
jgi:hypothetical protein